MTSKILIIIRVKKYCIIIKVVNIISIVVDVLYYLSFKSHSSFQYIS